MVVLLYAASIAVLTNDSGAQINTTKNIVSVQLNSRTKFNVLKAAIVQP